MIEYKMEVQTRIRRAKSCGSSRRPFRIVIILALCAAYLSITDTSMSTSSKRKRHLSSKPENEILFKKEVIKANKGKNKIFLGIFSFMSRKALARRQLIRDTYIQDAGSKMCSLAQYEKDPDNSECQVIYAFVQGGAGYTARPYFFNSDVLTLPKHFAMSAPAHANDPTEEDVIYLNIRESINGGKSQSWFQYASKIAEKYNFDYVAKADDDTVMNVPLLVNFLDDLYPAPYNLRTYGGLFVAAVYQSNYRNIGDGKLIHTLHAQGQFYYMSQDLAKYIGDMPVEEWVKYKTPDEDSTIANYINTHPRPLNLINNYHEIFWFHPCKTEPEFREKYEESKQGMLPFDDHKHGAVYGWFCPDKFPQMGMKLD